MICKLLFALKMMLCDDLQKFNATVGLCLKINKEKEIECVIKLRLLETFCQHVEVHLKPCSYRYTVCFHNLSEEVQLCGILKNFHLEEHLKTVLLETARFGGLWSLLFV